MIAAALKRSCVGLSSSRGETRTLLLQADRRASAFEAFFARSCDEAPEVRTGGLEPAAIYSRVRTARIAVSGPETRPFSLVNVKPVAHTPLLPPPCTVSPL